MMRGMPALSSDTYSLSLSLVKGIEVVGQMPMSSMKKSTVKAGFPRCTTRSAT